MLPDILFMQFYTDPVSGYVFRSMKDALRFVKTGLPGRLAILPKQKASSNVELADNASVSVFIP